MMRAMGTTKKIGKITALGALRKRELERAVERIRRLRGQGMAAFDELWEAVAGVVEGDVPLWRAHYQSESDFIAKVLPGETRRSVGRNVLVARSFSPADEATHGIAFLEEAALYAKDLAGAAEVPHAIDLDRLFLRVRQGDRTVRKPVRAAKLEELRRARRALSAGKKRAAKESPTLTALRGAFAGNAALRNVAVRASAREATFGAVPLASLREFGHAVAAVRLPKT